MTKTLFATACLVGIGAAAPAGAAQLPLPIQRAAACAPRTSNDQEVHSSLRVVGAQDTVGRTLVGPRDLIVVAGGREQGVDLGQQYFVRRDARPARDIASGPRAISTKGWIQIVAVNDTTAIASVEHACDGIIAGDFLEPYVPVELPSDIDRTDARGELDFSSPFRILFGDDERRNGAPGDFMVTDAGANEGIVPGSRFGIFRDLNEPGQPLASVGEAVAVTVSPGTSVFRITRARHAVETGDVLIPRR
jgi:hypothetical protein